MLKAIVFNIYMYLSRHLEEQPKQKWRKAQMKEWLDSKGTILYSLWTVHLILMFIGLVYPEQALKKDLWDVIKKSKTSPVYVTDKIAEEKGGF